MQDLCGFTRNEIREMLLGIRKICKGNLCGSCPLRADDFGNCAFDEDCPEEWVINLEDEDWSAFGD